MRHAELIGPPTEHGTSPLLIHGPLVQRKRHSVKRIAHSSGDVSTWYRSAWITVVVSR